MHTGPRLLPPEDVSLDRWLSAWKALCSALVWFGLVWFRSSVVDQNLDKDGNEGVWRSVE
jgi:hypothetical protein